MHKCYNNPKITWIVKDDINKSLLEYSDNIDKIVTCQDFIEKPFSDYEVFINLHPLFNPTNQISEEFGLTFSKTYGFYQNKESLFFDEILYGNKQTSMNMFQIYFKLAGMLWKGEGYDINYFPKTKSKKNRAGIAVAHANLRNYIIENIDLESMKTWIVPYKKNVFKYMDEINRCKQIITDDTLTLHLALYLRKKVHFLQTINDNIKIELFGQGKIYYVQSSVIK